MADINDPMLRQWWEAEFEGRDRPNCPFCDPVYSTMMPAADFTVAVREFLVSGHLGAIEELFWIVSYKSKHWRAHLDQIMTALAGEHYPQSPEGRLQAECDSLIALTARSAALTFKNEEFVMTALARVVVPVWFAENPGPEVAAMREMPVTCRDMIKQQFQGMPAHQLWPLRFDPQRDYGVRCYGNSAKSNTDALWQSGFFTDRDDADLPPEITKDVLLDFGAGQGVSLKKSWKRERLVGAIQEAELIGKIRREHCPWDMKCRDLPTQSAFADFWTWANKFWEMHGSAHFRSRLERMRGFGVRLGSDEDPPEPQIPQVKGDFDYDDILLAALRQSDVAYGRPPRESI